MNNKRCNLKQQEEGNRVKKNKESWHPLLSHRQLVGLTQAQVLHSEGAVLRCEVLDPHGFQ